MDTISPRTPVIVGMGRAQQRHEDHRSAKEPLGLMLQAVRQAQHDTGVENVLSDVGCVYVPHGRWSYRDPGRAIASRIGAASATSVLLKVGVLQQTAIGMACQSIANGEVDMAMVVGGEAGYRLLRAAIAGEEIVNSQQDTEPDLVLRPKREIAHPIEVAAGIGASAVAYYAIMDSAFRAARGRSTDRHRDLLATMYSGFSKVARTNPYAWTREEVSADFVRNPSTKNPMLAFPYTKYHSSSWSVDQASAMIFCSAAKAEALGIDRSKWVFPRSSTESNHMVAMSARPQLDRVPGAAVAGRAALDLAGITPEAIDFLELYSCFPVAVETYAREVGIDLEERQPTVTGGMTFAGGPYNNYVLESTCAMVERIRGKPSSNGFVTSVSGLLTKQGFGLYSSEPGCSGFLKLDFTEQVSSSIVPLDVVDDFTGSARICGYTVIYDKSKETRGVAVADTEDNRRTVVATNDRDVVVAMESGDLVGEKITVSRLQLSKLG